MKISCLCPTYKRPEHLANAVACFLDQDYSGFDRELIILDDAQQYLHYQDTSDQGTVRVISLNDRLPSLTAKFNLMAAEASGDVLVVWEDDDIFLPWHLSTIAASVERGGEFICYDSVYSTYGQKFGEVQLEKATGRFHSSWAFTRELFDRVGGYPNTKELIFDQKMGTTLRRTGRVELNICEQPGYIYRWGNGVYHGSQAGDTGYEALWNRLETLPAPWVGHVEPKLDEQTRAIKTWLMKQQSTAT